MYAIRRTSTAALPMSNSLFLSIATSLIQPQLPSAIASAISPHQKFLQRPAQFWQSPLKPNAPTLSRPLHSNRDAVGRKVDLSTSV